MSIRRDELENFLNNLLRPADFSDYCPNGLQVEGKEKIKKIAFSLSATKDSVEKTVERNGDALIVHHGLFWNFHGTKTLTGPFKGRIFPLVKNDINLFAYHLPLDANLKIGNAKTLAQKIGLKNLRPFGNYKGSPMGVWGRFKTHTSPKTLRNNLQKILSHDIYLAEPERKKILTMGIITGGANSNWIFSKELGLDSYLTGEMSEHDFHESKEANIVMFAGGHHATELFGIMALMDLIKKKFKTEVFFINSDNPA